MLRVKIINTDGLDYEDEEIAINKMLVKLHEDNKLVHNIIYRENSVIFEYLD